MGGPHRKCEGCELKLPSFGLPAEHKRRWCAGCARAHAGAVDLYSKKCEGCRVKHAAYGLPSETLLDISAPAPARRVSISTYHDTIVSDHSLEQT